MSIATLIKTPSHGGGGKGCSGKLEWFCEYLSISLKMIFGECASIIKTFIILYLFIIIHVIYCVVVLFKRKSHVPLTRNNKQQPTNKERDKYTNENTERHLNDDKVSVICFSKTSECYSSAIQKSPLNLSALPKRSTDLSTQLYYVG